jgi:hypothetical protein
MFRRWRSLTIGLFVCCTLLAAQQASRVGQADSTEGDVVGEVYASDASVHGSVVLLGGGTRLLGGSSVTAGARSASVHLLRGGELRVCPETAVTVNATPAHDLMLSMSTGALEAHYDVRASADSILTPDFRILLVGPGRFHVAVGADSRGNSCVRSLDGNTASVMVSELMGGGSYQVKPGEQVYFRNGSVREAIAQPLNRCGCPTRASNQPAIQTAANRPAALPASDRDLPPAEPVPTAPLPAPQAGDLHVQVDAPFVFHAIAAPSVPEPPDIAALQPQQGFSIVDALLAPAVTAPPAEEAKAKKHRGFFARIGGVFAAMFGGK